MMKKRFLFALPLMLIAGASVLCAQASIDPSHRFYGYAANWELRGLVDPLPPLRPYPLANIKQVLETVIENGSEQDAEIAKELWQEETGRAWHVQLRTDGSYKGSSADTELGKEDFLAAVVPSAFGELSFFNDFLSLGYRFAIDAFALGDKSLNVPLYQNREFDYAEDPATAGPFTAYIDMNDAVSVGTTGLFFQAGLDRRGYGPMAGEGTGLNDTALHAPNFSFTYLAPRFSYTQMLSVLGASLSYGDGGHTYDKYFALHAVEVSLFKGKLRLAYVENTIFGKRFDPSYLLPVPYMAIQTLYDAADNLQMGLVLKFKPATGIQFSADLLVDDMDVNNILKLNFDTRNRFALNLGASYAPESSICSGVRLSYLSVMPFMYTHWEYDSPTSGRISVGQKNYSDYTHYGKSLGATVPPDSDRIAFSIDLSPVRNLNLSVSSSFMRHGNVVESFTDDEAMVYLLAADRQYATDGSVFTHSMFENTSGTNLNVIPTGHHRLNYLTQDHIMYVIQAGLDADYTFFRRSWGTLAVTFGYDFECIVNKGVDSHLYPGGKVTANGDGTYTISGVSGAKTQAETVAYFKKLWAANLSTVVNNYITVGIRYTF